MSILSTSRYFLFLVLIFQLCSCDNEPDFGPEEINLNWERETLANEVARNFITPAQSSLRTNIRRLESTLKMAHPIDAVKLNQLQDELRQLWFSWQDLAIYQFGPMVDYKMICTINSFPADTDLIELNIPEPDSIFSIASNGFPAIDYLLNNENAIVQLADSLRLDFLQQLVSQLRVELSMMRVDNNGYLVDFSSEMRNGTSVASSLSLLVTGLDLYFQQFVMDAKIAIPAGLQNANVPRPEATEAFYGGYSAELLVYSLNACLDLLRGSQGANSITGRSLLNYLVIIEEKDLANTIEAKFEVCIQKANQLSDPLSEQINTDFDKVMEVVTAMEEVSSLIHTDMVDALRIGLGILEVNCE